MVFKVYDMSDLEMGRGYLLCWSSTVRGWCWCWCCRGYEMLMTASYTLDDGGSLRVELVGVGIVAFLLALLSRQQGLSVSDALFFHERSVMERGGLGTTDILEPSAFVILQEPMLPAKMPAAEAAVANDPLCRVLALLEGAALLLGRHPAVQRQRPGR